MEPRRSPLDDPVFAAKAWAHYRRMLRWTADLALGVIGVVWVFLDHEFGLVSIHMYIASALGLGLMMLLRAVVTSLRMLEE